VLASGEGVSQLWMYSCVPGILTPTTLIPPVAPPPLSPCSAPPALACSVTVTRGSAGGHASFRLVAALSLCFVIMLAGLGQAPALSSHGCRIMLGCAMQCQDGSLRSDVPVPSAVILALTQASLFTTPSKLFAGRPATDPVPDSERHVIALEDGVRCDYTRCECVYVHVSVAGASMGAWVVHGCPPTPNSHAPPVS
jgi:hypothetical protein